MSESQGEAPSASPPENQGELFAPETDEVNAAAPGVEDDDTQRPASAGESNAAMSQAEQQDKPKDPTLSVEQSARAETIAKTLENLPPRGSEYPYEQAPPREGTLDGQQGGGSDATSVPPVTPHVSGGVDA